MRRVFLPIFISVLLFAQTALAYQVPDRDYWRIFTLSIINQTREENDLPPIGLDDELNELAQYHAEDSAVHYDDTSHDSRRETYLRHVSSDGRTLAERVRDHRITGATHFGENVGLRYHSPFEDIPGLTEESIQFIHDSMAAQVPPNDGHRKTILGDYTHIGVGLEFHRKPGIGTNTLFFVTNYARYPEWKTKVIPELPSFQPWVDREQRREQLQIKTLSGKKPVQRLRQRATIVPKRGAVILRAGRLSQDLIRMGTLPNPRSLRRTMRGQ